MRFADRLKSLRAVHGLTQQQLADVIGMSKSTINMYERGEREPGLETQERIADFFNVDLDYLLGRSDRTTVVAPAKPIPPGLEPLPEMATVPLIGDIACGTPITAEQNVVDRINVPAAWRADYALTCHGDSMAPKIQDGDIVCVRCQQTVENGEVAVVLIDGEATLKRFYRQDDTVTLMPENLSACAPMVYQGPAINGLCIEGKAVGICRAV